MDVIRVKLNREGIRAVQRSAGVQADLRRRASAMANAAGEGFVSDLFVSDIRARASVGTTDYNSRVRQAKEHVLERAVDAGRG